MRIARLAPFLALVCLLTPVRGCAQASLSLWDVAAEKSVTLKQILPALEEAGIVLVGEQHDLEAHHAAQLEIVEALHRAGKPVVVALEMFDQRSQPILDRWTSGQMDEATFEPHFRDNWGGKWPLYREIFLYCRHNRIPMLGINVPRTITSQVARNGFSSLTPEQMGLLPMVTCRVNSEYMEIMRHAHGHGLGHSDFTRFCEAQLVWDTAMATYSLDYLKKNPQRAVVLLAGSVHAWKKGIPAQVHQQDPEIRMKVILPETEGRFQRTNVTKEDADYLILMP